VVRRIPDLNPHEGGRQATLFDTWQSHAFFTTSELDAVTADETHRHHAIIEQVHADLTSSSLTHAPRECRRGHGMNTGADGPNEWAAVLGVT
jgi:hypothetical protein